MKRSATILIACVLAFSGCQKRARVASLPPPSASPPPASAPPSVGANESSPLPSVGVNERADHAFVEGNYIEAARLYEEFLVSDKTGGRDEALFRLGLIYASPEGPSPDWQRATNYLKRLVGEHPDSPLKTPANLILSLYAEVTQLRADSQQRETRIRQLGTELEKLKKLDAERRKPK